MPAARQPETSIWEDLATKGREEAESVLESLAPVQVKMQEEWGGSPRLVMYLSPVSSVQRPSRGRKPCQTRQKSSLISLQSPKVSPEVSRGVQMFVCWEKMPSEFQ